MLPSEDRRSLPGPCECLLELALEAMGTRLARSLDIVRKEAGMTGCTVPVAERVAWRAGLLLEAERLIESPGVGAPELADELEIFLVSQVVGSGCFALSAISLEGCAIDADLARWLLRILREVMSVVECSVPAGLTAAASLSVAATGHGQVARIGFLAGGWTTEAPLSAAGRDALRRARAMAHLLGGRVGIDLFEGGARASVMLPMRAPRPVRCRRD